MSDEDKTLLPLLGIGIFMIIFSYGMNVEF